MGNVVPGAKSHPYQSGFNPKLQHSQECVQKQANSQSRLITTSSNELPLNQAERERKARERERERVREGL